MHTYVSVAVDQHQQGNVLYMYLIKVGWNCMTPSCPRFVHISLCASGQYVCHWLMTFAAEWRHYALGRGIPTVMGTLWSSYCEAANWSSQDSLNHTAVRKHIVQKLTSSYTQSKLTFDTPLNRTSILHLWACKLVPCFQLKQLVRNLPTITVQRINCPAILHHNQPSTTMTVDTLCTHTHTYDIPLR